MGLHIGMVTIDCAEPRALARFWSAALDVAAVFESDEFVLLGAGGDGEPELGLQQVPEPRAGKNRVHVDLRTDDVPAEVDRLVAIGASKIAEHTMPGVHWTVLADPAGNEFCVGSHDA
ncbi:glyoxalase [Actinocatenispora thailandica]|uniref:Glyoxalase n=1 Tax=Actinocatenispora thailandica TaxID=227318 RepID=A0A7R7DSJ4_9ACTN|nr:VOC family protein [Actinocatenispora thailandica]BCJ36860.1 glyoxalase [Actinocatenispora thailandica]